MITRDQRFVAGLLIVSLTSLGLPPPVYAGMVPTDAVATSAVAATGDRGRVASFLDRAEVRAQLEANGVNPAQLKARVAALTDDEAAQLAAQLDTLPAGGDGVGGILFLAVFVFLVLLVTDILGFTKIFPFTRPVR